MYFHPDLVVGASIGAINGWAIAGGCDPDELVDRWLHLDAAARYRWKFPRSPIHGVFDTTPLQARDPRCLRILSTAHALRHGGHRSDEAAPPRAFAAMK